MERGIFRHWPVMFVASAMALSFYAISIVMKSTSTPKSSEPQSYEMPRPKAAEMAYDLSRRQVIRSVRSLPADPAQVSAAVSGAAGGTQMRQPIRHNMDPKAMAEAAKKRAQAIAAAKKAAFERRKAQMAIRIQEAEMRKLKGFNTSDSFEAQNQKNQAAENEALITQDTNTKTEEEDTSKLSPAQWKSLLFGQPTAKNAAAFIAAFKKGQIDEKSFYQITEHLMVDSQDDRQKLALSIFRAVPSAKTFTVLASHYTEKTPEALRKSIYEILRTYGSASMFPVLARVLESKEPRALQLATQILGATLTAQNQTGQSGDRDVRGPGASLIPPAQFQTFVPVLRRLSTSGDGAVAQQAQSLLQQIQALQPV